MDKIAKVPHLREELDWLDQTYGVEKEGFFHQEHWQLLVAIMLSAQSTDKQVDEVLPKLYGRFPTVQEIAQATEEEIGEEIKSVGLYKSKAKHVKSCCMQLAEQYGGRDGCHGRHSCGAAFRRAGKAGGSRKKDRNTLSGGCVWNSGRDCGHACVSDFASSRLGKRQKSG